MAVTRLNRKAKRNKQVVAVRKATLKHLTSTPVLKNVNVAKIREEFRAKTAKKEEAPVKVEEIVTEVTDKVEAPAEEKAPAKKPAAKKATPKAEKAAPKKDNKE